MRREDVVLRLSTQGRDELLKTLRDMGGEYEKTANKVARASRQPTTAIRGVNAASEEAQTGFRNLANRGGPLAGVLSSIGPAGLAAAAGIGALTLGLGAALRVSREAVTDFAAFGEQAAILQLSTDAFQALELQAEKTGVGFAQVESATRALTERSTQLASGQGELAGRLKETNPQLLEQLKLARTNDERLQILAKAIRSASDETEQNRIAVAAFGEAGIGMVRVLGDVEGGLQGLITEAQTAGTIIGTDLIAEAERMNAEFAIAEQRIDNELKAAFIGLAPVVLRARQGFADATTALGDLVQGFEALEDRASGSINREVEGLTERLVKLGISRRELSEAFESGAPLSLGDFNVEFADKFTQSAAGQASAARFLIGEINELRGELVSRQNDRDREAELTALLRQPLDDLIAERAALEAAQAELRDVVKSSSVLGDQTGADAAQSQAVDNAETISAIDKEIEARKRSKQAADEEAAARAKAAAQKQAEADARRKAAQTLAEENKLRAQAQKIILELGGAEAKLIAEVAQLDKVLAAGFITQDQYDRQLQMITDRLDGTTDAVKRWAQAVSSARTPVERAGQEIMDLESDFAAGRIGIDAYNEALTVLKGNLQDATQRAFEATDAFKAQQELERQQGADADQVRAGIEQARVDDLSPEQRIAEEQDRLNKLVKAGALTAQEAAASLDLYTESLNGAAKASGALGAAESLLDGIQSGRIDTIGDLGAALGQLLLEYVQQQLFAQSQLGGSGGLLGGLFGGIFGGGSGGVTGGGFSGGLGSFFAGLFHDGGSAGSRPRRFRNMARGVGPDENLSILRRDEQVLTPQSQLDFSRTFAQLARTSAQLAAMPSAPAVAGGGGEGDLNVTVVTMPGQTADAEESRDEQGNRSLRLTVRDMMVSEIQSGQMDAALASRPGAARRGIS